MVDIQQEPEPEQQEPEPEQKSELETQKEKDRQFLRENHLYLCILNEKMKQDLSSPDTDQPNR